MDRFIILAFGALVVVGTPIGLAVAWFASARRVRELETRLRAGALDDESRTDALERSVAELRAELDQLARGQKFLARLVTTEPKRLRGEPPPSVTPH